MNVAFVAQTKHAEIEFLGGQNERFEAPKWVLGEVLGAEISKKNTNH